MLKNNIDITIKLECSKFVQQTKDYAPTCTNYNCIFHGDRSECYSDICNLYDLYNINILKIKEQIIDIIEVNL